MALINCENCGKQISDKAKNCPHCGNAVLQPYSCAECGTIISSNEEVCPNCGFPISDNNTEPKLETSDKSNDDVSGLSKSRFRPIYIILIVVIAGLLLAVGLNYYKQQAEAARIEAELVRIAAEEALIKETYAKNMDNAVRAIASGYMDASEITQAVTTVWAHAQFQQPNDFTDKYTRPNGSYVAVHEALNNLYSDPSIDETVSSLINAYVLSFDYMQSLVNPPEEFEDAYAALLSLYDVFNEKYELASTYPTGEILDYQKKDIDLSEEFYIKTQQVFMYSDLFKQQE